MTNYLFDLILIAIALITVIRCWKAGFAVSVLKFARLFICLIGAVLIGPAGHGILGFLVVFVVLFIAVTIVMSILKLITKIPIIHGIDKLLGLGLGLLCAAFYLVVLSVAAHAVLGLIDSISGSSNAIALYDNSVFFKFVYGLASKIKIFGRFGL